MRPERGWLLPLLALLLAGCAGPRLERALLADRGPAAHEHDLEALYPVRCPDVLDTRIEGLPDWSGQRPVGADGCVRLPESEPLRVDGLTAPVIGRAIAQRAGVPGERVIVHIAAHNSQQIYVYGPVPSHEQAVPYRGPETVVELLQRLGGLTPGAAPEDVRVLRAHVADGKPPEVFHVDLYAILLSHDQQTNVRLEPFDQVHIGRNRRAQFGGCFPPWLRPFYDRACGLRR